MLRTGEGTRTTELASSMQRPLVKSAVLHDHPHVPTLAAEQLEVAQRIAVDHQQVGKGPRLETAQLPFLAQDLGARERRRADDLDVDLPRSSSRLPCTASWKASCSGGCAIGAS